MSEFWIPDLAINRISVKLHAATFQPLERMLQQECPEALPSVSLLKDCKHTFSTT